MKKMLCAVVSAALSLGLLPFSAGAAPAENYPYVYETFETDGVDTLVSNGALTFGVGTSVGASTEGAFGNALSVTETALRFEAEDYIEGIADFKTETLDCASGGVIVSSNLKAGEGGTANYTKDIEIPVTLSTDGLYDIEAAVSDTGNKNPEYYSWVNVLIDGVKVDSSWWGAGKVVSTYPSYPLAGAPIKVRQRTDVKLTAGEHTITLQVQNAGSYRNPYPIFNIDYVELTPVDAKAIRTNPQSQATFSLNQPFTGGDLVRTACLINPATAPNTKGVSFVFMGKDAEGNEKTATVTQNSTLTPNQWNYVEIITPLETEFNTVTGVAILLGSGNAAIESDTGVFTYLLDDVVIEPVALEESPVQADVTWGEEVFLAQEVQTATYTFIEGTEGTSLVRVLKKQGSLWVTLSATAVTGGEIKVEIPQDAVNTDLKIEFVPIDNNGNFGAVHTKEIKNVKAGFLVEPKILSFNNTTVESETAISLHAKSVGDQEMIVLLAVYDEFNTLIDLQTAPIKVTVGTDTKISLSANTTTELGTGVTAKLFVWTGTDLDTAGKTFYTSTVIAQK